MNPLEKVHPSELETFRNYVVSGDAKLDKGDKMKRIGQVIICFLVYVKLISLTFSFTLPPENIVEFSKTLREYEIWLMTRVAGSKGVKQIVPVFGGFISATGVKPAKKSTIKYLTPIHQPFLLIIL